MEMIITIDQNKRLPLYKALSESIKAEIISGQLKPGQAVPSIRELASCFGTSRSTILRTYELLCSQGYIETKPKSGTRVTHTLPGRVPLLSRGADVVIEREPNDWTPFAKRLEEPDVDSSSYGFESNYQTGSRHYFPINSWKKAFPQNLIEANSDFDSDPLGYLPLRNSLLKYLSRARAINSAVQNLAVVASTREALDQLCRLTIRVGDSVAVSNPSCPTVKNLFECHGAIVHPISADKDGILVDQLRQLPTDVKILYVTPSHQQPTGVTTSLKRRLAILEWAKESGAYIWEDDTDNEFRYGKRAIPSMQGLDQNDSVIYSSSFRQTLGPLVHLAYVVLPETLVQKFCALKTTVGNELPLFEQHVLSNFISQGCFERHIFKTRSAYESMRQSLIFQLTIRLGERVQIANEPSGTTVMITFQNDIDDNKIASAAAYSGLRITKTDNFYFDNNTPTRQYLISFIHEPRAAFALQIERFAEAIMCELASENPLNFEVDSEQPYVSTNPTTFSTSNHSSISMETQYS